MAEEAMDMGIDKARRDDCIAELDNLSFWLLLREPAELAVLDDEISLSRHLRREDEVLCMQRICCHGASL